MKRERIRHGWLTAGESARQAVVGSLLLWTCSSAVAAQSTPPPFKLLGYEEDYRYLADTDRVGWARLKYIPAGEHGWLSLGGESRTLYDYRDHPGFGRFAGDSDGYWQQRLRVWGDYRVNPNLRVFGELASSFVSDLQTRPVQSVDRNTLELAQGFAEISSGELSSSQPTPTWRLRVGRQQIAYGWQRLLDPRDPANSRMPFDAARLLYTQSRWSGGLLWGHAVETRIGGFDDRTNDAQRLWGAHVEVPLLASAPKVAKLEALYLDTEQKNRRYSNGVIGEDRRHTLSARLSGADKGWDYDLELIGQRGSFGEQQVRAWQGTLFAGYTFDQSAWKPRLGFRLEASSGDRDANDGEVNTFNGLFSRASVFDGSMITSNVRYFGPDLVLKPTPKLWLNVYVLALQRQSLDDGIYAAGWRVIQPGSANRERDIGVRKVIWLKYRFNDFVTLDVYANHTSAGPFLRQGATRGQDYFYIAPYLTLRF
ncbi:alginate export family protein [Lysobacter sp. CA199]|uniref:alginate export family protein n=1 Tax=Lysobacter sp. CA199 TaxID=3455608 RepID=UPI003F8D127A